VFVVYAAVVLGPEVESFLIPQPARPAEYYGLARSMSASRDLFSVPRVGGTFAVRQDRPAPPSRPGAAECVCRPKTAGSGLRNTG
jgi:hypothetical protein